MRGRWVGVAAALGLAVAVAAGPYPPATADPPPVEDTVAGVVPEPAPAGVNDPGCELTEAHPRPVVLVHGFGATASENWAVFAPYLAERGFCVYALTYGQLPAYPGRGGIAPMQRSARQLDGFVDEVLAATGAREVDLVGHSEGGLMPRQYLRFLGGARKVARFVAWAPPNHGTTIDGLVGLRALVPGFGSGLGEVCPVCPQFLPGSRFLERLNAGRDETVDGVDYTVLVTRYDVLVTPNETSFLSGDDVDNIVIQDVDPGAVAGHASMAADATTFTLTVDALEDGAAR